MKSIAFHTLGCKVNQYDTEAMRESFERAGFNIVPFDAGADVYLINTCTVTGTGDSKSLKLIRRIARENPDADIIAAGCLAQRDAEKLLSMDNVRLAIGVKSRAHVVELYEQAVSTGESVNAVSDLRGAAFEELFVSAHEGKTRATMKIQEGCDRYCAYCIIPYVRGPVRSMPMDSVKREAQRLADSGYREIVITGIHLASYGRGSKHSLIDAVKAVHDTEGVMRVRLGSLEPNIVTPEFAEALSKMPGLMRQFHLSLQSGSFGVLKRMRRRYTPDEYYKALRLLRERMPDCAITTDVLTGFPGETDAEARETLEFVERCGFARLHVFPYSKRLGTPAAVMPEQVPEDVKKRRAAELIELGNKLEAQFVKNMIGGVASVLFETQLDEHTAEGFAGQYVRVRANAHAGDIENVLIIGADGAILEGTVVQGR